jgi:hypothetical protein
MSPNQRCTIFCDKSDGTLFKCTIKKKKTFSYYNCKIASITEGIPNSEMWKTKQNNETWD